jgi:hypothetical protein
MRSTQHKTVSLGDISALEINNFSAFIEGLVSKRLNEAAILIEQGLGILYL